MSESNEQRPQALRESDEYRSVFELVSVYINNHLAEDGMPLVKQYWEEMECSGGMLNLEGNDASVRVPVVTMQKIIETCTALYLTNNPEANLTYVIHTELPSTPLRQNLDDTVLIGLPEEVLNSSSISSTILDRKMSLKSLLELSNTQIVCLTKENSFDLMSTDDERENFSNLVVKYDKSLSHGLSHVEHDNFPEDEIGATYILRQEGVGDVVFSISAFQAHTYTESSRSWTMWHGHTEKPLIQSRWDDMSARFAACDIDVSSHVIDQEERGFGIF